MFTFNRAMLRAAGLSFLVAGLLLLPARAVRTALARPATTTAIQHLVVIYGENVSFDHYFATYPVATNPAGEPAFTAKPGTQAVNGLSGDLLSKNPNLDNPFRLDRAQALTCDQDHRYTSEQKAFNGGRMDSFVQFTASQGGGGNQVCVKDAGGRFDTVMGYYDGNTVTALWNYAQNFALSDDFFGTHFGPSTPGALALAAADTAGAVCGPQGSVVGPVPLCGADGDLPASNTSVKAPSNGAIGAIIDDPDPFWDLCSGAKASSRAAMGGKNIGDLLNANGVTWGWFEGGFRTSGNGQCTSAHVPEDADRAMGISVAGDGNFAADYSPHHEPFQYFPQTANPRHLPPTSTQAIGQTDQANHQYDTQDFFTALSAGVLPSVTFLKAPAYQDGHAGYSDPLDEQRFDVTAINALMQSPFWSSTAVVIAYDDSDGWYDHVPGPITNHSATPFDVNCGAVSDGTPGRCGFGPRLPLLIISPFAKQNFVSHTLKDQSSIPRFIEHNWFSGQRISSQSADNNAGALDDMFDFTQQPARTLLLDPGTGQPQGSSPPGGTPPGQAGATVTYLPGWNLVGAPAGTPFPQANNPLYNFPAGATDYVPLPNTQGVAAGQGYWAFFTGTTTVTLSGTSSSNATVTAPAGQYVMIGNPSATQTLTIRGADSAFTFDTAANSYAVAATLAAGQGAWVLRLAGGTVTVGP